MKVFFTLLLFSGFFSFGQESVDVVYRKLGLNACRCLNDSSIDEDLEAEFKKCDLLAYQNLSDTEK